MKINDVIAAVKKIEHLLQVYHKASGRSFADKISSSSKFLSPLQVQDLQQVLIVRNNIVNNINYSEKDIPEDLKTRIDCLVQSLSLGPE